ncbi:ricin B lectin domain-containing protein [Multifurca ochricompacta]|uniref:Ricin B lectin domain-containing protein n=1 Tax=Multifurca ochricompacta TaxID=376703 RepID=A0AAD4M2Z0_9AGAM|nr:ricin B lectin domain-containing protein [Multifurca ochricompacta]
MSIKQGGRYKITNVQTSTVVDLSGVDNKSIIGWGWHGGDNQRWILEQKPEDNGQWSIRSVKFNNKYIGFEGDADDGKRLVVTDRRQLWDIYPEGQGGLAKLKLWVPSSLLVADLTKGNATFGTPVQLWASLPAEMQVWNFEELSLLRFLS